MLRRINDWLFEKERKRPEIEEFEELLCELGPVEKQVIRAVILSLLPKEKKGENK